MKDLVTKNVQRFMPVDVDCEYTRDSDYETLRVTNEENGDTFDVEYARCMSYREIAEIVRRCWGI